MIKTPPASAAAAGDMGLTPGKGRSLHKGVKPPEAFGERPRDWSLGHAGDEGPHLSMTAESWGCSRAAAPVQKAI